MNRLQVYRLRIWSLGDSGHRVLDSDGFGINYATGT